jgi:hypothetical protein
MFCLSLFVLLTMPKKICLVFLSKSIRPQQRGELFEGSGTEYGEYSERSMNTVFVILLFVCCRKQENNVDTQCQSGSIQCGTIGCTPVSPQRLVVYWWCAVCRPCCDVIQFHERCSAHIHCPRVNNFRKQKLRDRGS